MTQIGILGAAAVQDDGVRAAQALGWTVHVLAARPDGPAAESADVFVPIDFSDRDAVVRYAQAHALDAVYSIGSDSAIPVSAYVSERLGLPHFVSSAVAEVCNRKPEMRRALVGIQGNVPAQEVSTDDDAVWTGRWPIIVKPADAQGQRGVSRVDAQESVRAAVSEALLHSRSGSAIIEEFIEGPEVSVNGYLVDGRLVFLAVSDRETWPEFVGLIASHVAPGDAADDDVRSAIHKVVEAAAQRLGITDGPLYAQMMVRDGQPYIIEITPRLDGCHMWKVLREATGVDLMDWTLRHLVDGSAPHRTERLINPSMAPVRLEFHCQPPQTVYRSADHATPADATERYDYYQDGATVRAVNGRFEKVGYVIRRDQGRTA